VQASAKKRILFVDDEPPVLNLLQVLCRQADPNWEPVFVTGGPQALRLMAEKPFDAVVTDMRMPEMNGAELLEHVRDRYPRTFRVVLSGFVDQPLTVRALAAAHQYQAKPFKFPILQSMLSRVFALDRYVSEPSLQEAICRTHLLPSPAAWSARLERELSSPTTAAETLGGLAAQDPALTAKLLQLVNSAFFGAARPLLTAKESAQALGAGVVRTLGSTKQAFWGQRADQLANFPLAEIAAHSFTTGLRASRIMALERGLPETTKIAFTAGVLHDIGKLVLAVAVPELHRQAVLYGLSEGVSECRAEKAVIGATHAQVGAYLLGLWGIPDPIVEVVAWHHEPRERIAAGFGPLSAVHVANNVEAPPPEGGPAKPRAGLDREYLSALRADDQRLKQWLQVGTGE
jgi:HD-like signal output (HDOD) protein/CheY-like chemotaxis protein